MTEIMALFSLLWSGPQLRFLYESENLSHLQAREALTRCVPIVSDRIPPAAPVDVWVAASGPQRYAAAEVISAQRFACAKKTLLIHDAQHLWRRLSVIANEDVGIADFDIAAQAVSVSGQKVRRGERGGDDLIAIADAYPIFESCGSWPI